MTQANVSLCDRTANSKSCLQGSATAIVIQTVPAQTFPPSGLHHKPEKMGLTGKQLMKWTISNLAGVHAANLHQHKL